MKKAKLIFLFGSLILPSLTFAQMDSVNLYAMSLEDLMNVSIVSASREKEDIYDAPITAYVITRQEIEKAGSTSIPDALRLCPSVFVTEMANGTYQVDIRGLNNTPAFGDGIINKSTLVMIDNRPVFNQFQGGTYWENLPVEINDVERLEIIAGPSAALYGPNAVSGVINIITRRLEKIGPMLYTNSQYDMVTNSYMTNLSAGYKVNKKLSFIVSGNYTDRKREVLDYYSTDNSLESKFAPYNMLTVDDRFEKQKIYADSSTSVNKKAINAYIEYVFSDKIKFDFSAGYQNSNPLRMLAVGPIGTASYYAPSNSTYVRGKGEVHGFSFQASHISGLQSLIKGAPSYQYDFKTTDVYVDYTFKYKSVFSLRPAVSYQNAFVSDLPYIKDSPYGGVFNNKAEMYNYAASLKVEFMPITMLRFVGAVRADRFRFPADKTFYSYEFAANFKPNENHNIRLIASRAFQGSYMFQTFVDFSFPTPFGAQTFAPNKDLTPSHIDLLELGYRLKIKSNFSADLSLFQQTGSGYYTALGSGSFGPSGFTLTLKNESIALKAIQTGATFSINALFLNGKIQFKPFVTISQTRFKNFSPYNNTPSPYDGGLNSESYQSITSNYTPSTIGGFFLNATPIDKLNINFSLYGYDKFSLYTFREVPPSGPSMPGDPQPDFAPHKTTPATDISANVLLNAKVSYQVHRSTKVFISGRNILNTMNRQFYAGDQIGAMFLVGVNVDY